MRDDAGLAGVVLSLAFVLAPPAGAAELTFSGCIANAGANGCTAANMASLAGAQGVAVSPDGQSVYVASYSGDSISHFSRTADGALTFMGCIADAGANGCTDPPMDSLDAATGVVVSPDGKSVYVTGGDGVTHFTRAADGALTFAGCIANAGKNGCTAPDFNALDSSFGIAINPNGGTVYVASDFGESISYFIRDADTGALRFAGCLANAGANGCDDLPMDALGHADGIAVSPDGRSVYVASSGGNSITAFLRNVIPCIANAGANGCVDPPMDALAGATGVVVSPDGRSVYVASYAGNSISYLTRAADGTLDFAGCIANGGANGCEDAPIDALGQAIDVAISPDGQSVFVASEVGDSISWFTRTASGSLAFAGCIADAGLNGCEDPPMDALAGVDGVAVSPDGQSVYAVSFEANSIVHFRRSVPSTTTTTLPAATCAPANCNDDDPCTADACVEGSCVRSDATGFASARCVCERAETPACAGHDVPDGINRQVEKACDLLLDADGAERKARKRKLLKKAASRWQRAEVLRRKRRTQRLLSPACLTELGERLLDAGDRTRRLRDTL